MATSFVDQILNNALSQSEADRARIAEALIASLEPPTDHSVELAWQQEIATRLNEIDTGTVKCIPWEEVRDRLYKNTNVPH